MQGHSFLFAEFQGSDVQQAKRFRTHGFNQFDQFLFHLFLLEVSPCPVPGLLFYALIIVRSFVFAYNFMSDFRQ